MVVVLLLRRWSGCDVVDEDGEGRAADKKKAWILEGKSSGVRQRRKDAGGRMGDACAVCVCVFVCVYICVCINMSGGVG